MVAENNYGSDLIHYPCFTEKMNFQSYPIYKNSSSFTSSTKLMPIIMLQNKLEEYDVILSSASPRRKQLLEELGIKFKVQVKPIVENYPVGYPIEKVAQYLSEIKAASFLLKEMKPNTLIITADTIVTIGNTIIGKPKDYNDAKRILKKLSGEKHNVITGVTLRTMYKRHSFSSTTEVYFNRLTDSEIDYYITNFKPYDKAGGYGIQDWIGHVAVKRIEGSYFNVMGLPTSKLYEELLKFVNGDGKNNIILDI